MLKQIRPAIVMIIAMTVITGLIYPLGMTGIAQLVFPYQANGSLIEKDGKVIGSALIGQNFADDKYFHGRPSATTEPDPKDPTKTIAGALRRRQFRRARTSAPTAQPLIDRVKDDSGKLAAENPSAPVPVDLVTTSASGLDPDITPAGALFQVPRVAKARGLPEDRVRRLVADNTQDRTWASWASRTSTSSNSTLHSMRSPANSWGAARRRCRSGSGRASLGCDRHFARLPP